jgi:hypothetical protein
VIDSGFARHPDIDKRVLKQVDFTGEGTADLYGHGTHVASIIAGSGVGSQTRAGTSNVGMAPGAALINLKVLSGDGTGLCVRRHRSHRVDDRQQESLRHSRHQHVARHTGVRFVRR